LTDNYILTSAAEADLRQIVRYTRQQWGDAQVRAYIGKLENGLSRLATGQGRFKELSELAPPLRMTRCEHHYLFCLPRSDGPALIVAILHERSDLMVRLADRLN
jgi:plasmid stabilization system protein ParE